MRNGKTKKERVSAPVITVFMVLLTSFLIIVCHKCVSIGTPNISERKSPVDRTVIERLNRIRLFKLILMN